MKTSKINHLCLTAVAALLAVLPAGARSVEEARAIAAEKINKVFHRPKTSSNAEIAPERLVDVSPTDGNVKIFANTAGGGFAIVSLNDNLPALLAVSEKPFSPTGGNPAFRNWLKAITAAAEEVSEPMETTVPDPDVYPTDVRPLIATEWGQEEPFYYMCPMENPSQHLGEYFPDTNHCVVGCVATSAAQIMKYYKFPVNGKGSASITMYDWDAMKSVDITADFAAATYEYDKMINRYYEGYTEEQGRAVALLSLHCGIMSNMDYGIDGSGTTNEDAIDGMIEHFDYDPGAHTLQRYYYDENRWMNTLYEELSSGRPVMYAGYTIDEDTWEMGGHSFIIDGYNSDGLVSVNWGWNGDSNGFYDISTLKPTGRNYSFRYYQQMTIGVRPNPSSVESVETTAERPVVTGIYTLDGRLLRASSTSDLPAGIYIVNGKKTAIK